MYEIINIIMENVNATVKVIDTDEFKSKVIKLKKRLPNQYMAKLIRKYPELDCADCRTRVYNLVALRIVDQELFEKLESIAI